MFQDPHSYSLAGTTSNIFPFMVHCKTSESIIFVGSHYSTQMFSQVVLVVKNLPANAGDERDAGLILELGRYPGIGIGNSLQYSCLENSMNRRAWWATVHGVTKSQT